MTEYRQDSSKASEPVRERGRLFHLRPLFIACTLLFSGGALFFSYQMLVPVLLHYSSHDAMPVTKVDLTEPDENAESSNESNPKPVLRLAVAPMLSTEGNALTYTAFAEYLAAKTARQPLLLQRSCYADVNDLVRFGWCELALVGPYAYVRGEQEFGMRLLAAQQELPEALHRSNIIVSQSSSATSLLHLKGKPFAFVDFMSGVGWLYPVVWLHDHGENPWEFFGKQMITRGHDNSVEAVIKGYVDGAAVDSLVYTALADEDPSIRQKTRVILESEPLPPPALVAGIGIDPKLEETLLATLLGMPDDSEGKKILTKLKLAEFVSPDRAAYDTVRALAQNLEHN